MTSREKTISSVVKNLFTMTDYICFLPFSSLRSKRKQPVAKNGGDGEGGLRFERRADYLPETITFISKHTDDSLLEGKDNVAWLFFLLTLLKKVRQ